MKNILILLSVAVLFVNTTSAIADNLLTKDTTEQLIIQSTQNEEQPLEKLLEDLKGRSIEKDIEIYYIEKTIKQTIIQEAPKEEYLEHLVQALKDSLKKGKKEGKIRRVEKNLIEIDKGAVHKVRERDVYKVYDSSSGAYKGKIEIQAIADAISIGQNYNLKDSSLNVNDTIKYLGNRKYMELGVSGGIGTEGWGSGLVWRYSIFGGWGFEILWQGFIFNHYSGNIKMTAMCKEVFAGAKKYFNFPGMICPYISVGLLANCKVDSLMKQGNTIIKVYPRKEFSGVPYSSVGAQFFSCRTLHIDLESRYIFIPQIELDSNKYSINSLLFVLSFSMSW